MFTVTNLALGGALYMAPKVFSYLHTQPSSEDEKASKVCIIYIIMHGYSSNPHTTFYSMTLGIN